MYLTIQGLVVRITPYHETDAFLTVLSKQQGKLTLKARGIRRKNSPLTAACQLLTYSEFVVFEYRGMSTINEAHAIEVFPELRKDLQKLSLGTYFAQVAEVLSQEDFQNPELLSLLLNSLYVLSKSDIPETQVKAVFEMRSACLSGYAPDLHCCRNCGNNSPDRFDISEGGLECASCRSPGSNGIRMPVGPGELNAMRYICGCEPKKLFSFKAGEGLLNNLANITESYLTTQLEQGFSALDFYKTLQNPLQFYE